MGLCRWSVREVMATGLRTPWELPATASTPTAPDGAHSPSHRATVLVPDPGAPGPGFPPPLKSTEAAPCLCLAVQAPSSTPSSPGCLSLWWPPASSLAGQDEGSALAFTLALSLGYTSTASPEVGMEAGSACVCEALTTTGVSAQGMWSPGKPEPTSPLQAPALTRGQGRGSEGDGNGSAVECDDVERACALP